MSQQASRFPNKSRPTELHDGWHHVTWPGWISRDPKHLKEEEKQALSLIHTSPSLDRAYELSQQFVTMIKERNAQQLASWLRACQMSEISDLMTFAQSLELEGSALQAALTLPWSNGPVEGKIDKLKYIKRSMYGRSGFPLLRQKVLKAG
jgi:transposase